MNLASLRKGTRARIVTNHAEDRLKERLLSLGFVKGNLIELTARSIFGGTIVVRVNRQNVFSLRRSEAEQIEVSETTEK